MNCDFCRKPIGQGWVDVGIGRISCKECLAESSILKLCDDAVKVSDDAF